MAKIKSLQEQIEILSQSGSPKFVKKLFYIAAAITFVAFAIAYYSSHPIIPYILLSIGGFTFLIALVTAWSGCKAGLGWRHLQRRQS
jgi:hypothetical protein